MTAEIAIMNKMAVALAADSAITISAGRKEEKIFDSADKLFELSNSNPIGIMIYNSTSFMQVPLPSLIREFRCHCGPVKKVAQIAEDFLRFLDKFGRNAPREVRASVLRSILNPITKRIRDRFTKRIQERFLAEGGPPDDPRAAIVQFLTNEIEIHERIFQSQKDAEFVGSEPFEITADADELIEQIMAAELPMATDEQLARLVEIGRLALRKGPLSESRTGIVISGFGSGELFPTLISFEIDGMVCDRLKFLNTNYVDIDRKGPRAQVIPFAQKEMVERFLYGLDEDIQRRIATFCKKTVPTIRSEISKQIEFEDDDERAEWLKSAKDLEDAFIKGLDEDAFKKIREQSRSEIEDMVEFMPKPELAKMAEALVNLTSIKRRVSRGMETVGGPIDVAVISQSEGFVWVKRKHYFPVELNSRYFSRVDRSIQRHQELSDGSTKKSRRAVGARGRKAEKTRQDKVVEGAPDGSGGDKEGNAQSIFGKPAVTP